VETLNSGDIREIPVEYMLLVNVALNVVNASITAVRTLDKLCQCSWFMGEKQLLTSSLSANFGDARDHRGLQIRLHSLPSPEDAEDMTCQLQIQEVVSLTLGV
jgi:hypothetical protein